MVGVTSGGGRGDGASVSSVGSSASPPPGSEELYSDASQERGGGGAGPRGGAGGRGGRPSSQMAGTPDRRPSPIPIPSRHRGLSGQDDGVGPLCSGLWC